MMVKGGCSVCLDFGRSLVRTLLRLPLLRRCVVVGKLDIRLSWAL